MLSWNRQGSHGEVAEAERAVAPAPRMAMAPKGPLPRVDRDLMPEVALAEYRSVAEEIGVAADDVLVEEFRHFLAKRDIPTFNHQEVVSHMDGVAARDNPTGLGWHWCPVRDKDAEIPLTFGRPSRQERHWDSGSDKRITASDFYESHAFQHWRGFFNQSWVTPGRADANWSPPPPPDWRTMRSPAYTRTIPLHALKKVALVEREFKAGSVVFLVSDYTLAPHVIINPDPFLMAVIPNSAVAHGKGRFIIDVWDEPGFGIDKMIK